MNEDRSRNTLLILLTAAAFLLIVILASLPSIHGEIAIMLITGWIDFIREVLFAIRIHWPSIITGIVSAFIVVAGVQMTGSWWMRSRHEEALRTWTISDSSGAQNPAPLLVTWRFRWSLALVALVVLLFAAGIVLVAIVHQATWLGTDFATQKAFSRTLGR